MSELDAEDAKLATLARSARARTGAAQGAAVSDTDGRSYVAATVALPSLSLSALQVAVAMAVSSGALGLEAALVSGEPPGGLSGEPPGEPPSDGQTMADDAGLSALRDVAPDAVVHLIP